MPSVTIILSDTPTGGVAIHHGFEPRAGQRLSPAQAHALDVINHTNALWSQTPTSANTTNPATTEATAK